MEDAPEVEGEPAQIIRAELDSISELVIRSDVPVGIALSGGLDSSAIAALAARKYPDTMHAFGVGYPGRPHFDERADAQALAEHLGMTFHDVEIDTSEVVEAFPGLVSMQDDPIADISGYSYHAISRAARERGIPVLLQGHGGDELFWGYGWVADAVRQSLRKSRLGPDRAGRISDYLRLTLPRLKPRRAPLDWLLSLAGLRTSWDAFRRDRSSPPEQAVFYDLAPDFGAAYRSIRSLYARPFRESLNGGGPLDLFTIPLPWPPLDILMTRLICETYLMENGIAQGDRLSMASSVELRLPFVDHRLVERVVGLRKGRSDVGLPAKSWLREAVRDLLPGWVLDRPRRGFQPPTRVWHRALFAHHGQALRNGRLVELGVLEPEAARRLAEGPFPLAAFVPLSFKALVLEFWCRQVLSPESSDASELEGPQTVAGARGARVAAVARQ
jgi:asparagine synthase (glutamine-hydrolysing)